MTEWQEYPFSELIELIGGGTPKTSVAAYWNGNIPWLSVADFNTGRKYVFEAEKAITELGLKNSSTKILNPGDIIISARGTVGVVAMLGKAMAFNQSCYGIRAKCHLTTNEFVYYLLKGSIDNFIQIAHGGVFDTITRDTFQEIPVLLPSLEEQEAIAGILSSLDDKIDLLHRQNQTLEALAQTLFRHWFIDNAQDDWEYIPLGEAVTTMSGGTPSRKKAEYFAGGMIPWVKSKELNGTYILGTEEQITEEGLKSSSAKILPKNAVLIAMYGATVGQYGILGLPATCNQAVCALLPNENYPYTFLYVFTKFNTSNLINMAVGSAQQNISQVLIKSLDIPEPSPRILEYHYHVRPLVERIKANFIQIRILEKLRDMLLPKLMSGEVRVLLSAREQT